MSNVKKEIKVSVTEEHIDKGVECDGYNCPIACALKDMGYKRGARIY